MRYFFILSVLMLAACSTNKTPEEYVTLYEQAYAEADYSEALKNINSAIDQDSLNFDYILLRSDVYNKLGKYSLAITDLTQIIDAGFGDKLAYYNRGVFYMEIKEYNKAIADFEKLYADSREMKYLFYVGQALYLDKKYKRALIYFRDVISDNPKNGEAYNYKGNCHMALEQKEDACNSWQKALELGVQDAADNIELYCGK